MVTATTARELEAAALAVGGTAAALAAVAMTSAVTAAGALAAGAGPLAAAMTTAAVTAAGALVLHVGPRTPHGYRVRTHCSGVGAPPETCQGEPETSQVELAS